MTRRRSVRLVLAGFGHADPSGILRPLEMTRSGTTNPDSLPADLAQGYRMWFGHPIHNDRLYAHALLRVLSAAGGCRLLVLCVGWVAFLLAAVPSILYPLNVLLADVPDSAVPVEGNSHVPSTV